MIISRCKNCIWFDDQHQSVQSIPKIEWKTHPGFCRKKRPNVAGFKGYHIGMQPIMDADEFCGEFRMEDL